MAKQTDEQRREYHRNYYHAHKAKRNIELERDENGRFVNPEKVSINHEDVINRYNSNESTGSIAKTYNVDKTIIRRILMSHHVTLRSRKEVAANFSKDKNPRYLGYGEISGSHVGHIKQGATRRKIHYDVSIEYLWKLFLQQNRQCALTGRQLYFSNGCGKFTKTETTASLDRIDSSIGYVEGNVQWVHKEINVIKWHFDKNQLLETCKDILIHNGYIVSKIGE